MPVDKQEFLFSFVIMVIILFSISIGFLNLPSEDTSRYCYSTKSLNRSIENSTQLQILFEIEAQNLNKDLNISGLGIPYSNLIDNHSTFLSETNIDVTATEPTPECNQHHYVARFYDPPAILNTTTNKFITASGTGSLSGSVGRIFLIREPLEGLLVPINLTIFSQTFQEAQYIIFQQLIEGKSGCSGNCGLIITKYQLLLLNQQKIIISAYLGVSIQHW